MLEVDGKVATGQGVATDVLEASARAYVRAIANAEQGRTLKDDSEVVP